MKIKKFLSIFLIVAMIATTLTCFSSCGSSQEAGLYRNGELVQTWDELIESCGYYTYGQSGMIDREEEYKSYFENCNGDLVLPSDITGIGRKAFYKCYGLTSVKIPEGVTSIGAKAFCNCRSLISVTIPESVKDITPYTDFANNETFCGIKEYVTIYGKSGSYAEEYANENGINFVAQ